MLKRIFGLALLAAGGALIWLWLRQRQDDIARAGLPPAPPPDTPDTPIQRPAWPGHGGRAARGGQGGAADADDDELPSDLEGIVGYCVRCRTKRPMADAHEEITENGRRAARGTCPECDATMFTFLKDTTP